MPNAKRTPSQPVAAAKPGVPASKTPSQPITIRAGDKGGTTPAASASRPALASATGVAKATYAPATSAAAGAASGTTARVVRAFTGGFPFAGLEYVLFIAVVSQSVRLALPVGLILLGLASGILFLQQQANQRPDAAESNLLSTVRQWLGEPLTVAGSLALLGAGLLSFARWNATRAQGFSVLAIIALVGAMLLLFVANYRRDAQVA